MVLRELLSKFGFDIDDAAIERADKKFSDFTKKVDKFGQRASAAGKKLFVGATLPVIGLGAAFIKAASDAEETESKFNTVFESISDESQQTARQLAKDFGLSSVAAKQLLGDTGDLLVGFGFSEKSALDLSSQVNQLAVDLASFTNFSGGAEGASRALTKALLGERESIKSLGISILEEDVKKQVQLNRTKGLTFETERQAKAFATLQLAQKQSQKAIGDFARTSQGFANQVRILRGEANDVAVSFGKILLPIALRLVRAFRTFLNFLEGLNPEVKTTILVVAGLVAALGPLLFIIGNMAQGIALLLPLVTKLIAGIRLMGTTALLAQAKLLLIPLAIAAIIGAIALIADDIAAFLEGRDSVIGRLFIGLEEVFGSLSAKFAELGSFAQNLIAIMLLPFRQLVAIGKTAIGLIDTITGKQSFKDFLKATGSNIKGIFDIGAASGSLGGALGLGESGGPLPRLAAQAETARQTNINTRAELNVNVQGLPPEAAKEAAQSSMMEAMGGLLRETARSARAPVER